MTKSEERKTIKANQRKLYLGTWAKEKVRGVSLSAFCKTYGLSRNNFYIWVKNENIIKNSVPPIQRADPKLKAKAIEIYLR